MPRPKAPPTPAAIANKNRIVPQKVKRATGGNSPCDTAWMQAIGMEEFLEFETPPPDCLWDVKFQFQGYAEEVEPEFFEDFRRGTRQCSGTAYIRDERGGYILDLDSVRLTRPCLGMPLLGSMVCMKHGGQAAWIQETARNRLSDAAEKAANALITLTDTRDEEGELVDQRVRVSAANSVLDRVGIRGGTNVDIAVPGYQNVLNKMFGDETEGEPS